MSERLVFGTEGHYYGPVAIDSEYTPVHTNEIVPLVKSYTLKLRGRVVRPGEWLELRYNDGAGWVLLGVYKSFEAQYRRKRIRKAMRRKR